MGLCVFQFWVHAQRKENDLLLLKNGNETAGKINSITDSFVDLSLRRGGKQRISTQEVKLIKPLRSSLLSLNVGFGYSYYQMYSLFYYKSVERNALRFEVSLLKLKKQKIGNEIVFQKLFMYPFSAAKYGYAYRYYIWNNYISNKNAFLTGGGNLNFAKENKAAFVNIEWGAGAEYFIQNKYRMYSRLLFQRNIYNINKRLSVHFSVGLRIGKEYSLIYRKFNSKLQ